MKFLYTSLFTLLIHVTAQAQITQTIRGTIRDKISNFTLEGVTVIVINSNPVLGNRTDQDGRFEIQHVPIGKVDLQVSYLGYETVFLKNLSLNSAKELVLNISMEEKILSSKDIIIKDKRDKDKALNEMTLVSARMFSVEETNKYAGSLNDPARMAQNFAGVQANGDTRNDIIIRGNSPLGVIWRLEGIDIPNPNHFAGIGTTGGAISILNNNNLSNSDFLTGAFPAQYGNATAGVFDLKLRNGNDKKREHTIMFGMNGLEAGTEGPLSKKNHSSYVVNYRYSTLGLFNAIGINFGAASVPKYQDGVFKIHLPTKKFGSFDVFGLGGYNSSVFYSKDYDTTGRKLNPMPKGFNTNFINYMGVAGLAHTYQFNQKMYGRFTSTYSINGNTTRIDSLYNNEQNTFLWLNRFYQENKFTAQYQINYKWNSQHNSQIGIYYNKTFFNIHDSFYLAPIQAYRKVFDYNGNTNLWRCYAQHQFKPSDKLSIVGGVNMMYFTYTKSFAVEPRLAMRYQVRKNMFLTAGAGIHHQQQPTSIYFLQSRLASGIDSATNNNLDFTKSTHAVLGLDWNFAPNFRLKLETYFQQLSQIPIEQIPSSFSIINEGAYYVIFSKPFLANRGSGYNKGIELTIEKFLNKNYYFLITGSLYKSMYKGSDGIERHTAFDGTYAANVLAGYDIAITKKSLLSINAKATFLGGRRYTPIDLAASQNSFTEVYIDSLAFTKQHPAYFRPDIRVAYRLNWKKVSQEWAININNFIDRDNIQGLVYDKTNNKVGYSYQIGFFPVIQYRLEF
ncbi:MAG: TonB-dependent receptor [Chitinophagaceae bacterium]